MRAATLAGLILTFASGLASAKPAATTTGFETWTPFREDELAPVLAQLRMMPFSSNVEASIWSSPDGATQATLVSLDYTPAYPPSPASVREFEDSMVVGQRSQTTEHLFDRQEVVGDELVAESSDTVRGLTVHVARRYRIDAGVVRIASLTCLGKGPQLGDCKAAQPTLRLAHAIPSPSPPASRMPATSSNASSAPSKGPWYELGRASVWIAAALFGGWFLLRRYKNS